jgi:SAM-dependent methyltransferase
MDNAPAQFDAHAATYADEVNRSIAFVGLKVDYFTRVKANYALDLLTKHFGATESLTMLDVGCGTGGSHAMLAPRLTALSGTDVSAASVDEAERTNPGVRYQPYDGQRLPYPDASFDAAMTVCVMHHVPPAQWPAFAAEMRRVVRPGGLALVFEHNPLNPLTRRAVSNCEFDADAVLLGQRRTRTLLGGAGFADVRSRAILSIPSIGRRTRALDRALGHLSLGAQYVASGVA